MLSWEAFKDHMSGEPNYDLQGMKKRNATIKYYENSNCKQSIFIVKINRSPLAYVY